MLPFRFRDIICKRKQRRSRRTVSLRATVGITSVVELLEERALLTANITVDLDASQDNTLYQDSLGFLSNGAGDHFFAGATAGDFYDPPSLRRGLLAFDIAAANIPAGSTITSAVLTLHVSHTSAAAGPTDINLHQVSTAWGEGSSHAGGQENDGAVAQSPDATWLNTFFSTDDWNTPGGDFESGSSATTSVDSVGFYQWTSSNLLADVQEWFEDSSINFGWAVIGEETNETSKRFDSRDNVDPNVQPVLTITYDEPVFPGAIQGQKWHDTNANGRFDSNESPINGWTIELLDSTGLVIETTRTAVVDLNQDGQIDPQTEHGVYQFDVLPGTYSVREVQQTGWLQSAPQFSSDLRPDNLLTNLNVTSEGAGSIWYVLDADTNQLSYQISTDQLDGTVTAIYLQDGHTIRDLIAGAGGNSSGIIAGTVQLSSSQVVQLQSGDLYVQLYTTAWPSGELRDQINPGNVHHVTITNNAVISGLDFGNYRLTSISGRKWYDSDNDGIRLPQSIIDLGLFIQNNNLYFDAYDGAECWFRGTDREWYFLTPDGVLTQWDRVPFSLTGTPVAQLDPIFYTDPTAIVRAGEEIEPFLNGWTIELLKDGVVVATDVTRDIDIDGDGLIDPETERGHYAFEDLPPGDYDVREFQQDGWAQTATLTSTLADTAFETDQALGLHSTGQFHTNFGGLGEHWLQGLGDRWYYITPTGDLYEWDGISGGGNGDLKGSLVVSLSPEFHVNPALLYDAVNPDLDTSSGSTLRNIDFGNYQTVSISGRTWNDINNNATNDDEPYLNGWTVELRNADGFVIATDVTHDIDLDDDGFINPATETGWYVFDELPPGTYTVVQIIPDGWVQVTPVADEFAEAAATLDRTLGFQTDGDYFRNFAGQNEVWLQDANETWYYITEDGRLFEWDRNDPTVALNGTLVATLSAEFNLNPSLLHDATPIDLTLSSGQSIDDYDFGNLLIETAV